MKRLWALVLIATSTVGCRSSTSTSTEIPVRELPVDASRTLSLIHSGGPFPFPKDGATFGNFEHRLPEHPRGYYHEYTVPTPGAHNRGARRIIAGEGATHDPKTSGEYYYTDDHYESFRRIRE